MKKYLILTLLFISTILYATEQRPDIILFNNKKYDMDIHVFSYPVLNDYFYQKYGKTPFTMMTTSNYRGYIATWLVEGNKLYLKKIKIRNKELELNVIFNKLNIDNKVFADWYSGIVILVKEENDYKSYSVLEIAKGKLIKYHYNQTYEDIIALYKLKYDDYNKKIKKPQLTINEKNEFNKIENIINKIHDEYSKEYQRKEKISREKNYAQCKKLYTKLPGYNTAKKMFNIKSAYLGHINSMPYSIFFTIETKKKTIDSIWWWNPVKNNELMASWIDMIEYYNNAEKSISKHQWLINWKLLDKNNSIEIHVLKNVIGATDYEIKNFLLPTWKHAGLKGVPLYYVLLRYKDKVIASLYFNNFNNILITSISKIDNVDYKHWIFDNKIFYHPTNDIPGYIVVNINGKWENNNKK